MNPVNRNTSGTETYSLNKGNLWFGVGGREYGPTSETNFYLGITPPPDGYVIYVGKASGGQANYVAASDSDLINIVNSITSNSFSTVKDVLDYVAGQDDLAVISRSEPAIVANSLVLNLDASSLLSYPTTGSNGYDTSGNGNDGTLANGAIFDSRGWFDFDGTDDEITVPDNNTLDLTTSMSFEFLVKVNSSQNNPFPRLIDKSSYLVHLSQTSPFSIAQNVNTSSGLRQVGVGSAFSSDEWIHILTTYDGQVAKIYTNSKLIATNSWGSVLGATTNSTVVTIGGDSATSRQLNGSMAKTRVYSKVLSASEVKQNYYGGPIVTDGLIFAVDGSNLVSYESGSATAYSLTGSNSGTLNNGVSFSPENGGVLYFDGSDDYVEFTDNYIGDELAISNTQDYTLEAWIKVETSSGTTTSAATIVGQTSSTGYGFQVGVSGGKPRINYGARSTSNFYSSTFEYNEWIHVTLVKLSNAGCRSFLNGELDTTFGSSLAISNPSDGALRLGNASPRVTGYYDGAIGPVRIYNRALSDEEVAQNYLAQAGRFT
jgi:hypothetical protein